MQCDDIIGLHFPSCSNVLLLLNNNLKHDFKGISFWNILRPAWIPIQNPCLHVEGRSHNALRMPWYPIAHCHRQFNHTDNIFVPLWILMLAVFPFSCWKHDFIFSLLRFFWLVKLFSVNVTWDTEWQNNDNPFWGRAISRNWMSRMCVGWTMCALTTRLASVDTILTPLQECVQTNRLDISQMEAETKNKDLNTTIHVLSPVYFGNLFG